MYKIKRYFYLVSFLAFFAVLCTEAKAQIPQVLDLDSLSKTNNKSYDSYVEENFIHFGLMFGGDFGTTYANKKGPWSFNSNTSRLGLYGGAFFEWDFEKKRQFFLHLELGVGSGATKAESFGNDTALGDFEMEIKYLNIVPELGVGYRFLPDGKAVNAHILLAIIGDFPEPRLTPAITVKKQDVETQMLKSFGARAELAFYYEFAALVLRYQYNFLPSINIKDQKFNFGHLEFLLRFRIF